MHVVYSDNVLMCRNIDTDIKLNDPYFRDSRVINNRNLMLGMSNSIKSYITVINSIINLIIIINNLN